MQRGWGKEMVDHHKWNPAEALEAATPAAKSFSVLSSTT